MPLGLEVVAFVIAWLEWKRRLTLLFGIVSPKTVKVSPLATWDLSTLMVGATNIPPMLTVVPAVT